MVNDVPSWDAKPPERDVMDYVFTIEPPEPLEDEAQRVELLCPWGDWEAGVMRLKWLLWMAGAAVLIVVLALAWFGWRVLSSWSPPRW